VERIARRLDEGVLPILHGTIDDEDVLYELTAFAALESQPLTAANVRAPTSWWPTETAWATCSPKSSRRTTMPCFPPK